MKALSFFTGAMGLDLGLERAGFDIVLASEIEKHSIATIKANRPDLPLIGDIWDYTPDQIREAAGVTPLGEIDLVCGGPPCQSFSTAGKRRGVADKRGNALLRFVNTIIGLQPRYAVIENVRGLLSAKLTPDDVPGSVLLTVLDTLRAEGYGVSFNLYNTANFGSPQIRERLVVVCSRDGSKLPYLTPTHSDDPEYGLPEWVTFETAVRMIKEDGSLNFVPFPTDKLRLWKRIKPGQNWRSLPSFLYSEALGAAFHSRGGRTGFLRRLAWDRPAPTLLCSPAMPATALGHPEQDRFLSISEYKRLQEFPDGWIVSGPLAQQYRQIGNAVPLSLGEAIGKTVLAHDAGRESKTSFTDFPYSRYKNTSDKDWGK